MTGNKGQLPFTERNQNMKKTLYCGIDLHSNNAMYFIQDEKEKVRFKKRLPNRLDIILESLEPFRTQLKTVAVESTYNWYWLVDGLMEANYPVCLANPAAIQQYDGLKNANDLTDAAFLAHLAKLDILPTGYIYPKEERPIRDLLRRRMLLVQKRTSMILSLQNMVSRHTGQFMTWRQIRKLETQALSNLLGRHDYLIFVAQHQLDLIEQLSEKVGLFEDKVLEAAKLQPEFEVLLTMPGIGVILGLTIMLETGTIKRFPKAGDYCSYCRVVRAKKTSNGKSKGSNNSKNGNKYLSWAFVEAAHCALATCPAAKKFYNKKKAIAITKGGGTLATKSLAAKWCKAAYYIMKRQEPFDLARVFG
jgi:transposase